MFRKSNKPAKVHRRLCFESLQNRVLLDATPIQVGLDYNSEVFPTTIYKQELGADFQKDALILPANVMLAGVPSGAGVSISVSATASFTWGGSGGTDVFWGRRNRLSKS